MKTARFFLTFPLILIGSSLLFGAQETAKTSTPVAKVGSTILTDDEMRKDLGMSLYEAENNLYQLKKNWVDQKAKDTLFNLAAKDAGLSRQEWQAKEIDSKVQTPTEDEINQWAPRFRAQDSTAPLTDAENAKIKDQAKQYLTMQKRSQRESEVYASLTQKYPVELLFAKPEEPHIEVSYSPDDPYRGPKNAPVTIVEFTDFQCPFCKRSQPTIQQIEQTYGDKVKLVERQYPLPFHNRARPSAEAALCAKEQGKFWEMHDKLFPSQSLEDADFNRFAKEIGLNMKKFDACLAENRYNARIEKDIADGQRFGVRGTPHFFINGKPISGAQPFEVFKASIDEELTKK